MGIVAETCSGKSDVAAMPAAIAAERSMSVRLLMSFTTFSGAIAAGDGLTDTWRDLVVFSMLPPLIIQAGGAS